MVGYYREAHEDGGGSDGIPVIGDGSEGNTKGKNPVSAVFETIDEIALLVATKGQSASNGPIEHVYAGVGVTSDGYDIGAPAHFHALFGELIEHALAVPIGDKESEDAAFLQFADGTDGNLITGRGAEDGGKAWHTAIDELNTQLTQDGVGHEALETVFDLFTVKIANSTGDFASQESGGTGVKAIAQIGQPKVLGGHGWHYAFAVVDDGLQVGDFLGFYTH